MDTNEKTTGLLSAAEIKAIAEQRRKNDFTKLLIAVNEQIERAITDYKNKVYIRPQNIELISDLMAELREKSYRYSHDSENDIITIFLND